MTERIVSRSFFCLNTAQKLPENEARLPKYCPELLPNFYKKRSSKLGDERLPEHCPSAFYNKNSELTSPLIEVQILPIIFCLHCPETEKGQNRSPVISGVNNNNYYSSYLINVFYKIGG